MAPGRRLAFLIAFVAGALAVAGLAFAAPSLLPDAPPPGSGSGDLIGWEYDPGSNTLVYWERDGAEGKCDPLLDGSVDTSTIIDGCFVLTAETPGGGQNHGAAVAGAARQLRDAEDLGQPIGSFIRDIARSPVGRKLHPTDADSPGRRQGPRGPEGRPGDRGHGVGGPPGRP